jgi:hypothetical protein
MANANTPYSMNMFTLGDTEVWELVCQIIWMKGRKLSDAKGLKELFTTMLHAIKGRGRVIWSSHAHSVTQGYSMSSGLASYTVM